jgi:hypothetical protein
MVYLLALRRAGLHSLGDPAPAAALTANGLGPPNPKEPGIFTSLAPPGQFTAVIAGKNGGIGINLR